ncbi:hypothetical protein V8J36_05190 [Frigidibacter sp. MR17.14]|uniref:hypothetical protein n=1 Tax=Frigidibacter sp. MR17.14 TaxID=3126509 RepID=UPI00301310C8
MGHHYYYLECVCGHRVTGRVLDLPEGVRNSSGTHLALEVIPRLVCLRCGRRGRPAVVSGGWDGGGYDERRQGE